MEVLQFAYESQYSERRHGFSYIFPDLSHNDSAERNLPFHSSEVVNEIISQIGTLEKLKTLNRWGYYPKEEWHYKLLFVFQN